MMGSVNTLGTNTSQYSNYPAPQAPTQQPYGSPAALADNSTQDQAPKPTPFYKQPVPTVLGTGALGAGVGTLGGSFWKNDKVELKNDNTTLEVDGKTYKLTGSGDKRGLELEEKSDSKVVRSITLDENQKPKTATITDGDLTTHYGFSDGKVSDATHKVRVGDKDLTLNLKPLDDGKFEISEAKHGDFDIKNLFKLSDDNKKVTTTEDLLKFFGEGDKVDDGVKKLAAILDGGDGNERPVKGILSKADDIKGKFKLPKEFNANSLKELAGDAAGSKWAWGLGIGSAVGLAAGGAITYFRGKGKAKEAAAQEAAQQQQASAMTPVAGASGSLTTSADGSYNPSTLDATTAPDGSVTEPGVSTPGGFSASA